MRVLTSSELASAGGGERLTAGVVGAVDQNPKPKSNAWSATDPALYCS